MAWSIPEFGGDCSAVQEQHKNPQQVQATRFACATILAGGSVVAWGHPVNGGDCSAIQDHLKNVLQTQASVRA